MRISTIILYGPPGSGKGTQAKALAKHFNLPVVSTGELVRSHPELSQDPAMCSGGLIRDEVMNDLVAHEAALHQGNGFILDGYPRTLSQSLTLDNWERSYYIPLIFPIYIDVPWEVVVGRLSGRGRDDDQEHIIKQRLATFKKHNGAIMRYYGGRLGGGFYLIDGNQPTEAVTDDLVALVEEKSLVA